MPEREDTRRHKTGRRPNLRLDHCRVSEPDDSNASGYVVTIEGVNLRRAISPPTITIGGQLVRDLHFAPDGRSVTGMIDSRPASERLVVDYGFARAVLNPE